jgi:hypothetical protein
LPKASYRLVAETAFAESVCISAFLRPLCRKVVVVPLFSEVPGV